MTFSEKTYRGYILKGDLIGTMDYVRQFPEQTELYSRYADIFEREHYLTYDTELNDILTIYQKYYRDVFYLRIDREKASDRLRTRLIEFLGIDDKNAELDGIEENCLEEMFRNRGLYFMGGRTSGYYGPYIWRTSETRTYEVELPDGVQTYTVKLLDGFISRSWADYLSFGKIGTGGWTDSGGIINCIKSSYDLDSESFKISLLKHEAQHARDLTADPNMTSENLEYRAKLVELIYSSERSLIEQFIHESEASDKDNGHAAAANRIVEGYTRKFNLSRSEITRLSNEQVQAAARELFMENKL